MTRLWIAHVLCFTMLNTCVLHLGEQFMESGVKWIRWRCRTCDSQHCCLASHWSMLPSARSDWPGAPMCSSVWPCYCDPAWHGWHQLTPDTNCFHLSLQSYQESLTNTNWHVIPSMWEKWRMFELRTKWRSHAGCGTLLSHHDKCPHAYLQSFCQNFHNFNPFMQNFLPSLGKVWFNCSKKLKSWIKVQKFLPKYQLLHQPNLI